VLSSIFIILLLPILHLLIYPKFGNGLLALRPFVQSESSNCGTITTWNFHSWEWTEQGAKVPCRPTRLSLYGNFAVQ